MARETVNRDVIQLGPLRVRLVYFDSMGAKCSSVLVQTPHIKVIVDPGAAVLQPSFPLPLEDKMLLFMKAYERIRRFASKADMVIVTHYHYDHHPHPDLLVSMEPVFHGKTLLVKDPNQWINQSQNRRAHRFLSKLHQYSGDKRKFKDLLVPSSFSMEEDPFASHPKTAALWQNAKGRRGRVMEAKKRWFQRTVEKWRRTRWIPSFEAGDLKVLLADGKEFRFGSTEIRFSPPMFHGQFLNNIGWVVGFTVSHGGSKFLFTSDLQGPIIEEYADWIIREKPDIVVLDGPPIYAYGFMIGKNEVDRITKNMMAILSQAKPKEIIWDHHLCRGPFRKQVEEVFSHAEELGVKLCTASEHIGFKPLIEQLQR